MMMKRALLFGAVLLTTFSHAVQADTRTDVKSALNRCDVFADDRTWLNCIYGAVQPMRGRLGLPPAPASQTNLVPSPGAMPQYAPPPPMPQMASAPPPVQQQRGGESFMSFMTGGQKVLTNVPLTAYGTDQDGLFTITLANGEVWHEMAGSPLPHWHGPASHYMVSITKGSMDSFNLVIEGIQYKAKRVR
jgi:hypothetical protein